MDVMKRLSEAKRDNARDKAKALVRKINEVEWM